MKLADMEGDNMTNENEIIEENDNEELDEIKEAVVALQAAIMVAWDNFEEVLNETQKSPLYESITNVLKLFGASHYTLLDNNVMSNSMQFGKELNAFRQISEAIHAILESPAFSAAQWGVAFANIEKNLGFPAAVMDCFHIHYCPLEGFEICGLKPIFEGEELAVHAWGAAHKLVEMGELEPIHLEYLPKPAKKYFLSFDNDSESEDGESAN